MATKIYTKTGDKGTTALFGGQRVAKHSPRIETYGTIDELNSVIGLALTTEMPPDLREHLSAVSSLLFTAGSDLATPLEPVPKYGIPRLSEGDVVHLEVLIDAYTSELPQLKNFILPGGTPCAAYLHLARTVCRRAERSAVVVAAEEHIGDIPVKFLNRLSDYLFTAARYANFRAGITDTAWRTRP
ncbi:cob(I)yrinic acid a,c-diamide adenosyltransferase [Ignavibacteria bacterium]|nr:cob(I)yrinic acid a,c-diamide adenosyltransferase [Bacteroidota bacterium]MCZ2132927.1 cob(I)yrinic acid a,c-diamide adenosyltransferase [Bacteroidota bacterium]